MPELASQEKTQPEQPQLNALSQWGTQPTGELPEWLIQIVQRYVPESSGHYAAQLLWQRGVRDRPTLLGFLDSKFYQPASPFEFGQEMRWAVERLQAAYEQQETVAIWGDFDADGITATAVLWDGLGEFFPKTSQLFYYIPNRLTESHGLSLQGIDKLAAQGCQLIVTCDTGSTNLLEVEYAQKLGIDLIITDHHTLASTRPPVTAIINPRYLPDDHSLAHLSGVAVAYKLIEALYETLLDVPQRSLEDLLDLVAIGLIADLVQLTGDCRYLAQKGIERLQQQTQVNRSTRPGVARLLELCKKSGDRPTDISFGLGPRINAVSRIYGSADFCVELLTSQDAQRCNQLAEETELANARRKALQKDVAQQVAAKLNHMDLSTTSVIVLVDSQWSVGVLGLVAGQIAQKYDRPTILLSTEGTHNPQPVEELEEDQQNHSEPLTASPSLLARGSARSVNQIDLYQLVKNQEHLLHRFGGHPFAAGLSIPVENIPLFTEAVNRQLREQQGATGNAIAPTLQADLIVTVADLGKDLFRELKLLEPCGMGNPTPKLLIQNCWFKNVWNRNIQDWRGGKIRYIKTEFEIWDDTVETGFLGTWWEHYKDDIPLGRCDSIVELDFNTYKKRYEIRLLALRSHDPTIQPSLSTQVDWLLDWRGSDNPTSPTELDLILRMTQCPASWDDLQAWFRRAIQEKQRLAIAYPPPNLDPPQQIWQQLIGIAKYLDRTHQTATRVQLQKKLGIGDRSLQVGFKPLKYLGFAVTTLDRGFQIAWSPQPQPVASDDVAQAVEEFLEAVQEEQFRRQYFYKIPLATIQAAALNYQLSSSPA